MTIDEQLRDIARRADQLQQAITADEIVQRASSQDKRPLTPASRLDRDHTVVSHMPVQPTEEEVTMIDVKTSSPADERRTGPKRVVLAALVAAAAVVVIALVAIRNDDPVSPAHQPSPTVTVPPTLPPRPLFATMEEQDMQPGTYFVDEVAGRATPRIFITLGEGWRAGGGFVILNDDVGVITFSRPEQVFADACHAGEGFHPGPVTTLDGLVAALSEQAGWVDATTPSAITVNGYAGKTFERTAPADFTGCTGLSDAPDARFRGWNSSIYSTKYEPNEAETLLVLDLNGSIILIQTHGRDAQDASALAGLAAVLDSIRIEQA
jgi:hypothetical protein